MDCWTDYN